MLRILCIVLSLITAFTIYFWLQWYAAWYSNIPEDAVLGYYLFESTDYDIVRIFTKGVGPIISVFHLVFLFVLFYLKNIPIEELLVFLTITPLIGFLLFEFLPLRLLLNL